MKLLLSLTTLLLVCASTVQAQNETFFIQIEEGHPEFDFLGDVPANHTPWDLMVDVSESHWIGTEIFIELDTGSMLKERVSHLKPSSDEIAGEPALRWDSWVTAPITVKTGFVPPPNDVLNAEGANLVWVEAPPDSGSGIYQIGRFTFSNDATGRIFGSTADQKNVGDETIEFEFSLFVENGQVVPEPSTLLLAALGLLGLLGYSRRRRR